MTKKQAIETLKTQLPGFYSPEQVIDLINKIEEPSSSSSAFLSWEQINEITSDILARLNDAVEDLDVEDFAEADRDSASFELHGNEIILDEVCLDFSPSSLFDELEGDLSTKIVQYLVELYGSPDAREAWTQTP